MNSLLIIFVKLMVFATPLLANSALEPSQENNLLWHLVEQQIDQHQFEINFRDLLLIDSDLKTYLNDWTLKNASEIAQAFYHDITTLTDRRSIVEGIQRTNEKLKIPRKEKLSETLKSYSSQVEDVSGKGNTWKKQVKAKLVNSITRLLHFYDNQLDEIKKADTALALIFLKEIDDKHGKVLQKQYPLEKWIQDVCKNTRRDMDGGFCESLANQWKNKSAKNRAWKPASILQKLVTETDDKVLENIGNEKDGVWGPLNGQCQLALVNRCEVPYVCERTLLDPTPRSQYLLTHQLLHRILIETVDCPSTKTLVTKEEDYAKFCAKMYVEAKYLDMLDVPTVHRDLFTEMVGLCGYMGYANFLREDWLDRILSWQSKSDSGCFVKDPLSPVGVLSTDIGFQRRATQKELEQGVQQTNEKCLPHLTAVGLMALSAHWDYTMTLETN